MRVFQLYGTIVHKSNVPFKDMFSFLDSFLREHNWNFREILFEFDIYDIPGASPYTADFLDANPYWLPFHITPTDKSNVHRFTNAPETKSELYTDEYGSKITETHIQIDLHHLSELMKKVPRPLNFPSFSVKFDGIDWLNSGGEGSICFTRSIWPNGANCEVIIIAELTDKWNPNDILDDSGLIKALKERFFGTLRTNFDEKRICEFDEEEKQQLQRKKSDIEPLIAAFRERTQIDTDSQNTDTMSSMGTRYSVKKPIKTIFKDWDYQYEQQGAYFVRKILNYGYRIDVELMFKPGWNFLERFISISGVNFHFQLASDRITRSSQEAVDAFVADCYRITCDIKQKLIEPLFELYGETPPWYFKILR